VHVVSPFTSDDELLAVVDTEELAPEQGIIERQPEMHSDIFAGGDRELTLGTDEWVTLPDGSQIKTVYSADGKLLHVNGRPFEMWSKTNLGLTIRGRITVEKVVVSDGGTTLVITGRSRGIKGETKFSREELQTFVDQLSMGSAPEFPVSTFGSTGYIQHHDPQEEE
jgi:hypothetical protein